MCDSIANGPPRYVAPPPQSCPPANVTIASNVLDTNGNVIAGNVISVDGTFTGNLYVTGQIYGNIIYNSLNIGGVINTQTIVAGAYFGNGYGLSNLNAGNLTGTIQSTNLPVTGVTAGLYGDFANVSQVVVDQYGRVTTASNVAILSSQWTSVAGNVAFANGVSIGTLSAPPVGSNLLVLGTANMNTLNVTTLFANSATIFGSQTLNVFGVSNLAFVVGDAGGLSNVRSSVLVGNVASANTALVVTQGWQPNLTAVQTLSANLYTGNASGLSNLTGANVTGIVAAASSVTVAAQPNVTSLGTLTGLTVSGLLTASNGSGISNLTAAAITGNVANANVALVVSQPAQPNITSLGTLTALAVAGGVTAGTFYGSGSGLSGVPVANLTGTVNFSNTAGSVTVAAQPNITSLGTLTGLYSTGNLTASFFIGGGNALSNVQVGNLVGTVNYANTAGVVVNSAQPNITSLGSLTSLTVIGSLIAGTISGDGQGLYLVPGSAINGTVATANSVVRASQPNITSVGTLTGLNVQGLLIGSNASGLANLNASNLSSGTLSTARLPTSGVTAGLYGSGSNVSQVAVDQYGRVTAASNVSIVASQWTGTIGNPIYYQNFVGIGSSATPGATLTVTGNAYVSNGLTTPNLFFTNQIQATNLPTSGVTAGLYGSGSNVSQVTVDQYGRVTTASNVAIVASQWTSVAGNVAYQNGVSVGTLSSPPVGSNLYVLGLGTFTNVAGNGAALTALQSSVLVGNVAQANVALVVSQPAQPNITSVGTLTGLTVSGLVSGDGGGLTNVRSSVLTGNVANANVALIVSQPAQPNITSVGTLTGLTINGLLTASNGSGISNIRSSVLVGNVANANVALVVSQAAQPNVTSLGTLTSLNVSGTTNTASLSVPSAFTANSTNVTILFDTLNIPFINVTGFLTASNGSGIANLTAAAITGNVANANVALVVSQPAQPNITSVGTLTGLTINGLLVASNASGLSNIPGANVSTVPTAQSVTLAAQTNITSVGTLTGLTISGLLVASNASGLSNIPGANVSTVPTAQSVTLAAQTNITSVGTLTDLSVTGATTSGWFMGSGNTLSNLNASNVAFGALDAARLQAAQTNITSLGTLTGLTIDGLLVASNASGLSNIPGANVSTVPTAQSVTVAAQPNITSLGTLTGLTINGLLNASNGSGIANLTAANITGNVANANVALVISQGFQPNLSQVSNLVVNNTLATTNLSVSGNVLPVTQGNTYVTGNLVVAGNVFSALGTPLGSGGALYFSLGGQVTPSTYTGVVYGQALKLSLAPFSIQGSSTVLSRSANGAIQFSQTGVYNFRGMFCTTGDNITGVAIGSNVIDYGTRTDQTYVWRHVPFVTQNPTAVFDFDFYVGSTSAYYYIDLFAIDAPTLQPTSNALGGTWLTIGPSTGGGAGGTPVTLTTLGNCVFNASPGAGDYYVGVSNGTPITLPLGASLTAGKQYVIKDESGLAGTLVGYRVTVSASGSDLIDGQASFIIALNYGAVSVVWTGTKWSIF